MSRGLIKSYFTSTVKVSSSATEFKLEQRYLMMKARVTSEESLLFSLRCLLKLWCRHAARRGLVWVLWPPCMKSKPLGRRWVKGGKKTMKMEGEKEGGGKLLMKSNTGWKEERTDDERGWSEGLFRINREPGEREGWRKKKTEEMNENRWWDL